MPSLLRTLSLAPFFALATLCLGHAISLGLAYADDARLACMARCLAEGHGYATPWGAGDEPGGFTQFSPDTGVGPTLVLPVALAIRVFGNNETVPGTAAICLWLLALIWINRKVRQIGETERYLFPLITTLAVVFTFLWHVEIWTAPLGEAVTALSVVLSILFYCSAKGPRDIVWAGLLFGVAVEAKLIAILCLPALFLAAFLARDRAVAFRRILADMARFAVASCVPIAAFELWKLCALGRNSYLDNWRDYYSYIRDMGVSDPTQSFGGKIAERLEQLHYRFGINPYLFVALIALMFVFGSRIQKPDARRAVIACLLATSVLLGYWFFVSIGWPRYAIVALILLCATYGMMVSFAKWPQALAILALAIACHWDGAKKLPYPMYLADNGLFRPCNRRIDRQEAVARLEARIDGEHPSAIASQGWQTCSDIAFLLKEPSILGRANAACFGKDGYGIFACSKHFYNASVPDRGFVRVEALYAGNDYTIDRIKR